MTLRTFSNTTRQLSVLLVLGILLPGCGGGSNGPATNVQGANNPENGLVSSWNLNDAGFDGLVPLLRPRASFPLDPDYEDSALSPDGSKIAFVKTRDTQSDRRNIITIYGTTNNQLYRTIEIGEQRNTVETASLTWSDNDTLHAFYPLIGSSYWSTWNTVDGNLVQSQSLDRELPCNEYADVGFGVSHVGTQALLYRHSPGTDPETSYLCRLGLDDYSRETVELDFNLAPRVPYQVISTDGTMALFYEKDNSDSPSAFASTRVLDTRTLQETREPYPVSHGTIELLSADYSIVERNNEFYFLPGEKQIDTAGGIFSASESSNVVTLSSTGYSDDGGNSAGLFEHIRFMAMPSGIAIGDVPADFVSFRTHRHISQDGSTAVVENNGELHVYDLTGRSQVSVF